MKNIRIWVSVLLVTLLFGCGGDGEPPVCLTEDSTDYHLVLFRGSSNRFISTVSFLGGSVERLHREIGVAKVSGLSDAAVKKLKRKYGIISIGTDVEVDWLRERVDEPVQTEEEGASARQLNHTDPTTAAFYNIFQWNMRHIGTTDAWPIEQGNENVRVAIVDSGISADHLDLNGRYDLAASANFTTNDPNDLVDYNGHGTQVASIVSTNNTFIAGLAPHATMVGIKVLEEDGTGNFSDLIAGIMHAVIVAEADIINISFGSHFSSNYYSCSGLATAIFALKKAIKYAQWNGVLVVAAAGDGDDTSLGINLDEERSKIHLPSQLYHVLSVGATAPINQQHLDSLASYSNYGMTGLDVVAPGGNDLSGDGSFLDGVMTAVSPELVSGSINRFNTTSGTGIAAAHVSALAALISAQSGESLSAFEIKQRIFETCDDIGDAGRDERYGHGRINAFSALSE